MKKTHFKKSKRGFTLIELLAVITIIGILAALVTPSIMGVIEKATRVTDINNLKQIGLSLATFASDYDGNLPLRYDPNADRSEQTLSSDAPNNSNEAFRDLFARGYLTDEKVFFSKGSPLFKKPDGVIKPIERALSAGECPFSYFAGLGYAASSNDIVAWNPTGGGIQRNGNKGWKAVRPNKQIHKGEGVVVLYFDGSVEFKKKNAQDEIPLGGTEASFDLNIKAVDPLLP